MKDKGLARRIAEERVSILIGLASKSLGAGNKERARRYARLASELIRHYRIRDRGQAAICKSCKSLLEPGITCDVRLASSARLVIYRCRVCGRENKTHY